MKRIIPAFLLLLTACSESEKNILVVDGQLKNAPANTMVYLEETSFNKTAPTLVDSVKPAADGSYKLSAPSTEENIYLLRARGQQFPFATLINDTKAITVNADLAKSNSDYIVKGSPASSALLGFLNTSNSRFTTIAAYSAQIDSMQRKGYPDSIVQLTVAKRKKETDAYRAYIDGFLNNSQSPNLSVYVLGNYMTYASFPNLALEPFTDAQVKEIVSRTVNKFPEHKGLATLRTTLEAQPKTQAAAAGSALLNQTAPDFTLPEPSGTQLSLSSLRGKYVLVDFWASWCQPCRQENPNVVAAYNQFRNKNFTILGVSLDKERSAWQKAIAADKLAWKQVSDLQFWNSPVVPLYGVQSIPYNVLVNPEGTIIAENLRGPALAQKLSEVLK